MILQPNANIFINSEPYSDDNMELKAGDIFCVGSGVTIEQYQQMDEDERKKIYMYRLEELIHVEGGDISDDDPEVSLSQDTEKLLEDDYDRSDVFNLDMDELDLKAESKTEPSTAKIDELDGIICNGPAATQPAPLLSTSPVPGPSNEPPMRANLATVTNTTGSPLALFCTDALGFSGSKLNKDTVVAGAKSDQVTNDSNAKESGGHKTQHKRKFSLQKNLSDNSLTLQEDQPPAVQKSWRTLVRAGSFGNVEVILNKDEMESVTSRGTGGKGAPSKRENQSKIKRRQTRSTSLHIPKKVVDVVRTPRPSRKAKEAAIVLMKLTARKLSLKESSDDYSLDLI